MNPNPAPEDEMENTGTGARPDKPAESGRPPLPAIDAGLELPADDAALALDLLALSVSAHPDEEFVTRLQGELTRKRLASPAHSAYSPTLAERLRQVMQTAWNWTLPAGAVILLILVVSLLLQMRPRLNGLSS